MESGDIPSVRDTMSLLWRHQADETPGRTRRRGRPPRVTVDQIVIAAIAVADAEGMAALSMARVAEDVGVATMTLYTHVPHKAALVELMVDTVLSQRDLVPSDPGTSGDWRERIVTYARRTRAMYGRHPWLRETSAARTPLGPGALAQQEYLLAALHPCGLPARELFAAAGAIDTHVTAAAREEVEYGLTDDVTGQDWDAWWADRQHVWQRYFDPERYPAMSRVWVEGGLDDSEDEDLPDSYDYGLHCLLDGIQARAQR